MNEVEIEGATFENVYVNGKKYESEPAEEEQNSGEGGVVILLSDIFGNKKY